MSQEGTGAASGTDDRYARAFVREVAPVWYDRFARLIRRELPQRHAGLALDVHCRAGQTSEAILRRSTAQSKLLALQADERLNPHLSDRIEPEWQRRFYVRQGNFDTLLDFPDDEFDLTVANLVLGEEVGDWRAGLTELMRITKPGGRVLATMCLRDTWLECDEIFSEVLQQSGLDDATKLHHRFRQRRPTPDELSRGLATLGLKIDQRVLVHERFRLLFGSARELLFAPVIESGPLKSWKALTARSPQPSEVLWRFKEALDHYHKPRGIGVTIHAALLNIEIAGPRAPVVARNYWQRFPSLQPVLAPEKPGRPAEDEDDGLDFDIDIEDERPQTLDALPHPNAVRSNNPQPTRRRPPGKSGREED